MKTIMLLILSLVLLGGCGAIQSKSIVSPNFVEEHLPRLNAVENSHLQLERLYNTAYRFGFPLASVQEELQKLYDLYAFYLAASYFHLANGNLVAFNQAVALVELQNQKSKDLIKGVVEKRRSIPVPSPSKMKDSL